MSRRLAAGLSAFLAVSLHAQSGSFAGTILQDTLGHAVVQAQVDLPELQRTATTDARGNFAFSNIAPGRHALVVRALGFEPLVDTISIAPGQRLEADVVLQAVPVNLAMVRTTAKAAERRLPIGIQEMEERRKTNLGGYYVTDSMLRADNDRKLTYFLARIPGLRQVATPPPGIQTAGSSVYLMGGHGPRCYVEIYVDGVSYFRNPPSSSNQPPDFDALWANGYSGVEYYAAGATVPAQYNATHGPNGDCGTMLLWTRRTP